MNINVRKEVEKDYKVCEQIIDKAFEKEIHSDHREKHLVAKLRKSDVFIPELSLVAEVDNNVVGHIMYTKIIIKNDRKSDISLALAPISVLPKYQRKGIGSKLINESLEIAKKLGYQSVIVLGHTEFYPKFGFVPASKWNIKCPCEVLDEYFMALELQRGALNDVSGTVIYSKEFFENE